MSRGGRCDKRVTDATQDAVNEVNQATPVSAGSSFRPDQLGESADRNCSIYDRAYSDPIYTENREKIAGKVSADKSGSSS